MGYKMAISTRSLMLNVNVSMITFPWAPLIPFYRDVRRNRDYAGLLPGRQKGLRVFPWAA